jgi:hypothetical protein
MDIYRAQKIAEGRALNPSWNKSFVLVGPRGVIECEWLDPYFGLLQLKGKDGFVMVSQIPAGIEAVMPSEGDVS